MLIEDIAEEFIGDGMVGLLLENAIDLFEDSNVLESGSPAGAYTLEPNGQIVFAAAPAEGVALTWSGYFYFGCRFLEDALSLEQITAQLWSGKSLKFTSIRP